MNSPRLWPALLLGLGALFAALMAWSVHRATTRGTPVSDPAYYRRGADLDRELAARLAARRAGWAITADIREGDLHVRVAGAGERTVSGADVLLELSGPRPGSPLRLAEGPAGEYVARLPEHLPSPAPARLRVRRGDARLERSLLLSP